MTKSYTNAQLFNFIRNASTCMHATGIVGFVLMHNYKKIYAILEDYNDKRNEVIQKYGVPQDNGTYTIDNVDSLRKASLELHDYDIIKHDVDIIKVPEDRLVDSGLTTSEMMAISWMVESMPDDTIRSVLDLSEDPYYPDKDSKGDGTYDVTTPPTDDRFV